MNSWSVYPWKLCGLTSELVSQGPKHFLARRENLGGWYKAGRQNTWTSKALKEFVTVEFHQSEQNNGITEKNCKTKGFFAEPCLRWKVAKSWPAKGTFCVVWVWKGKGNKLGFGGGKVCFPRVFLTDSSVKRGWWTNVLNLGEWFQFTAQEWILSW